MESSKASLDLLKLIIQQLFIVFSEFRNVYEKGTFYLIQYVPASWINELWYFVTFY